MGFSQRLVCHRRSGRSDQMAVSAGTAIEADQRLVVYASGRDVVTTSGELHTNFRLTTGGEALVLVDPGGTVIAGFDPAFPPQATNVSYGIDENLQVRPLIGEGAAARALVPSDDSLGSTWTGGNEPFDDSAWTSGSSGVGYETGAVGGTIAAPIAYWTFDELNHGASLAPDQRGNYDGAVVGATLTSGGGGRFGEALTFDGDNDYVNVGVVSELVNPAAFSMSLWLRRR